MIECKSILYAGFKHYTIPGNCCIIPTLGIYLLNKPTLYKIQLWKSVYLELYYRCWV